MLRLAGTVLPLLAAALALAGCGPRLNGSPEPDRLAARRQLAQALKSGPAPLVVAGDPAPLAPSEVPILAARGVTGLTARFAAAPAETTAPHLVLWFDPPPDVDRQAACGPGPLRTAAGNPPRLLAVWCDDLYPVASVRGTAGDPSRTAAERLVWETTGRLLPDDYPETYGLNLFGWRVKLGADVGIGR